MATLRSEEYWERRAAARMDMIQADAETTLRKLNRAYRGATASMSVQINSMVRTFGKRYGLSPEEAAKILAEPVSKETLEILRKTVESMPEGMERSRAMATLNAPSARFRISNTQAMRTQAQAVCSKIADEEYKLFTDSLTKSINSAYMRTQYDLQMGLGLSWKTTGISKRVLKQLLNEDWSGANYRTRIMGRYADLGNELSTLMLEGMLGGRSQEQLVEEMRHQFAMDARDARRLLVTETTYVVNAAELERYKEWGTKEYIYMAVLDLKTSDICATLDGMVIAVKYAKAGKNFPPMHPNCRSTTAPVVNRRILEKLTRKATNPVTGEIMTLEPGMTYRDWYKQVMGEEKNGRIRQTGGKYRVGSDAWEKWDRKRTTDAEKKYELIRKADDVGAVAKASGMSVDDIRQIKHHVFYSKDHKLYDGVGPLHPDYNMAVAWQRLTDGNPLDRDILLLKHELLESQAEKMYNITVSEAHAIAKKEYAWDEEIEKLFGEDGEPDGLLRFD